VSAGPVLAGTVLGVSVGLGVPDPVGTGLVVTGV